MKWPKWSIVLGSGDFLPILIGCACLLLSAPAFVLVLAKPGRNSGVIGAPLLIILGSGIVIGVIFLIFGLRVCAFPGSRLYRITHGRIFSR